MGPESVLESHKPALRKCSALSSFLSQPTIQTGEIMKKESL